MHSIHGPLPLAKRSAMVKVVPAKDALDEQKRRHNISRNLACLV